MSLTALWRWSASLLAAAVLAAWPVCVLADAEDDFWELDEQYDEHCEKDDCAKGQRPRPGGDFCENCVVHLHCLQRAAIRVCGSRLEYQACISKQLFYHFWRRVSWRCCNPLHIKQLANSKKFLKKI